MKTTPKLRHNGDDLAAGKLKSGHREGLAVEELGGALVRLRANGDDLECRKTKRLDHELKESRTA